MDLREAREAPLLYSVTWMSGSKLVPGDGTAADRFAALFPLYPPRAHTDLRQASVTEATVATYIESLNRFKFFIAAWGIHGSFGELLEAPEAFESTLVFFVQWLYDNGHPRSHATALLLSALAFFHPRLASIDGPAREFAPPGKRLAPTIPHQAQDPHAKVHLPPLRDPFCADGSSRLRHLSPNGF